MLGSKLSYFTYITHRSGRKSENSKVRWRCRVDGAFICFKNDINSTKLAILIWFKAIISQQHEQGATVRASKWTKCGKRRKIGEWNRSFSWGIDVAFVYSSNDAHTHAYTFSSAVLCTRTCLFCRFVTQFVCFLHRSIRRRSTVQI